MRGSLAKFKEEYKDPLSTDFIYFNEVFCSAVGFYLFFFLFYISLDCKITNLYLSRNTKTLNNDILMIIFM